MLYLRKAVNKPAVANALVKIIGFDFNDENRPILLNVSQLKMNSKNIELTMKIHVKFNDNYYYSDFLDEK